MSIFREKSLVDRNFFQRILSRLPKENAYIEINNLLAQNENQIQTITSDKISLIAEKYKIDLKKSNNAGLIDLFIKHLKECLLDKKLDQSQIDTLNHLKVILFLDETETQEIIKKETEEILSKQVKLTFATGKMDDSKWESLDKLKSDLLISTEDAEGIYKNHAEKILEIFMQNAISDKRYSPDEEKEFREIANNFAANLKIEKDTETLLKRFRLFWEIDNGNLPIINSEINLQKSESLHFKTMVTWEEQRKVTTRYNYAGPTARIKIVKGIYYRAGSMSVRPQSEDVWQTIDTGTLCLTNKRLIFMGEKGNKTIPINKILDFKPYSNGVDIQKDSGKSPFLRFTNDTNLFSMILNRLMK